MSGTVPLLSLVLLLLTFGSHGAAAESLIYPPLHNNEAVIVDPILVAPPYGVVPEGPYSMSVAYDVPPQHHHHNQVYDAVDYRPAVHEGDLPPNQHHHHHHAVSTRVDEYGRPIPPPTPKPAVDPPTHLDHAPISETEARPKRHEIEHPASEPDGHPAEPVYDDEPFLHRALDKSQAETDVTNALDHDLGELNVKESGDDLTVHVGKNKVKTETVATITATITATDEHEDSYINVHRNAHEASAGHEHDHLDGRTVHLDGAKHDALDQQGGAEVLPAETPPPDLSFLQDVEVLKVLFPWLEKHTNGEAPEQLPSKSLDRVALA